MYNREPDDLEIIKGNKLRIFKRLDHSSEGVLSEVDMAELKYLCRLCGRRYTMESMVNSSNVDTCVTHANPGHILG